MAKKTTRSPVDQKKKLLITAIKKVVKTNSVLPILEDAYLTGDEMIVSDLETYVSIPYKVDGLPEGGACVGAKLLVTVTTGISGKSVWIIQIWRGKSQSG
jgi:DNA polymerase III sliding clamp (beta) subunit (PCNA family)